jgi:hypothetical protein
VHTGLTVDAHGTALMFAGTDLQLSESVVFQADWIDGTGNAISFGASLIMPDQKTVINPAFLFSNDHKRIDGFFLNISRQMSL